MMLRFITTVTLVFLLLKAGYADNTVFTVKGEIDDVKNGTVQIMLTDMEKGFKEYILDTIIDHKFAISGKIAQPVQAFIFINRKYVFTDFMLEGGAEYTFEKRNGEYTLESNSKENLLNDRLRNCYVSDDMEKLHIDLYATYASKDTIRMYEVQHEIEQLYAELSNKRIELIKNNPILVAPAYRIYQEMNDPYGMKKDDVLKKEYEAMGEAAKNTDAGKAIYLNIQRKERIKEGMTAPDFTATTPDGKEIKFSDIKAKLKMLDFWASWCAPCRRESPNVVKIYNEFKHKGLEIVGFSLDNNAEKWRKAISDDGLSWIHISDLNGWKSEIIKTYAIEFIPTIYLMDENNIILGKFHKAEELKSKILEFLND